MLEILVLICVSVLMFCRAMMYICKIILSSHLHSQQSYAQTALICRTSCTSALNILVFVSQRAFLQQITYIDRGFWYFISVIAHWPVFSFVLKIN